MAPSEHLTYKFGEYAIFCTGQFDSGPEMPLITQELGMYEKAPSAIEASEFGMVILSIVLQSLKTLEPIELTPLMYIEEMAVPLKQVLGMALMDVGNLS